MSLDSTSPEVFDFHPPSEQMLEEVIAGMRLPQKHLPTKYLYDERGSQLFEAICQQPEYYPTRAELQIMREHSGAMADALGPDVTLIELGSGASLKTKELLDRLDAPAAYVPLDISKELLEASAKRVAKNYPQLEVLPVCADFTRPVELPATEATAHRHVVYFPGSTVGNFHPNLATALLQNIGTLCGSGGGLLIGIDLKKSKSILDAAYNDARGVTAAFNLNILRRLNVELNAGFRVSDFEHLAYYNEAEGRIEMHLRSLADQEVAIGSHRFTLVAGETICTEYSYKYSIEEFAGLAGEAGFQLGAQWTDDGNLFGVLYFHHQ